MELASFEMRLWATIREVPAKGRGTLSCPACGYDLALHQPDDEIPGRLLATCTCEECAIWLALVFTPDRSRVHMVRIPSTAEFQEAMWRRGNGDLALPK